MPSTRVWGDAQIRGECDAAHTDMCVSPAESRRGARQRRQMAESRRPSVARETGTRGMMHTPPVTGVKVTTMMLIVSVVNYWSYCYDARALLGADAAVLIAARSAV